MFSFAKKYYLVWLIKGKKMGNPRSKCVKVVLVLKVSKTILAN